MTTESAATPITAPVAAPAPARRPVFPESWGAAVERVSCPVCLGGGAVRALTASGEVSVRICDLCHGTCSPTAARVADWRERREKAREKARKQKGPVS